MNVNFFVRSQRLNLNVTVMTGNIFDYLLNKQESYLLLHRHVDMKNTNNMQCM